MYPLRLMKSKFQTKQLTHKTEVAQMLRLLSKKISKIIQMTYQAAHLQSEAKSHLRFPKKAKLKFQMWKARRRLRKLQTLNLLY